MAGDDHEQQHAVPEPAAAAHPDTIAAAPPAPSSEWTARDARDGLSTAAVSPSAPVAAEGEADLHAASGDLQHPPSASSSIAAGATPAPRRSPWPVAAGLVVGAIIGAGSAFLVYAYAPHDLAADQRVAALADQVDALNKRPDLQPPVAALKASITELAGKVAALQSAGRATSAPPVAAAPPAAPPPSQDVSGLKSRIDALQSTLQSVQQQSAAASDLAAAQGKIAAAVAGLAELKKQGEATRADVQALQGGQKSLEGKITSAPGLAVVADSLVSQISRGLPFAPQLKALESLGVDPAATAILRQFADQGVPSAAILAQKFEPLTDGLLNTGTPAPPNAGFWDRIKGGMGRLVSVRRVDQVGGDDVPSRVARIKADLDRGDVVDAVRTWSALPDAAKARPESAAWGALAKTHAEAMSAANAIEREAIASLSAKKS